MSARRAALVIASSAVVATFLYASESPATVEEQRRRLPPPAICVDPVEGIWRGLDWDPNLRQWYEYTLEIHREEKDRSKLTGKILSRFWDGVPDKPEPPVCRPGIMFVTVGEPARGTFRETDRFLFFGGTTWKLDANHCPQGRTPNYNPDHFSGKIDPAIQEFQSVNNDGGVAINDATVLRRIRCFDDPAAAADSASPSQPPAKIDVAPPPWTPPTRRARSCFGTAPP